MWFLYVLWKMLPTTLQFLKQLVEFGSKRESILIDLHVKMANFQAEINMFSTWYKKRSVNLYIVHLFKLKVVHSLGLGCSERQVGAVTC